MSSEILIETERLWLRQWQESDYLPFIAMNKDQEVIKFLPKELSSVETVHLIKRLSKNIKRNGWGAWAVELKATGEFIGFIGFIELADQNITTPCNVMCWRLMRKHWGKGYATEGARAALDCALNVLKLTKVVSFLALDNQRSEAVMLRLGMVKTGEFDHPDYAETSLARHTIYEAQAQV